MMRATSADTLETGCEITLSVDVTNTGARDGDEVVEFYVRHLGSKVERPARELKGFGRINIPRGQTRTVSVPLKAESPVSYTHLTLPTTERV